jgi:hypothetical protein
MLTGSICEESSERASSGCRTCLSLILPYFL